MCRLVANNRKGACYGTRTQELRLSKLLLESRVRWQLWRKRSATKEPISDLDATERLQLHATVMHLPACILESTTKPTLLPAWIMRHDEYLAPS